MMQKTKRIRGVRSGLRNTLIALGIATLSVSGLAQTASADASDPAANEQLFVDLINKARAEKGLPALTVAPVLVDFGRAWSEQMRKTSVAIDPSSCTISHNPKLGSIKADWRKLGENVGCGDVGVVALNKDFIDSPLHYANMVDPRFTHVGIGIVYEDNMMWVTEQFMELRAPKVSTTVPAEIPLVSGGSSKVLGATATSPDVTGGATAAVGTVTVTGGRSTGSGKVASAKPTKSTKKSKSKTKKRKTAKKPTATKALS